MKWVFLILLVALVGLAAAYWSKVKSFLTKTREFFQEVGLEMKKVAWPTRDHIVNCTIVIGVAAVVLTILVGIVDLFFGHLVGYIFKA